MHKCKKVKSKLIFSLIDFYNVLLFMMEQSKKIVFNIPEEYKNLSGVYIITNSVTDQVYIGRTHNFFNRYKEHLTNLNNNKVNHKFKTLLFCYPEVKFTYSLLESTDDIVNREKYYIIQYDSVNNGLNVVYSDEDFLQRSKCFKDLDSYKEYKTLYKRLSHGKKKTRCSHQDRLSISQFIKVLGKKRTSKDKRYQAYIR